MKLLESFKNKMTRVENGKNVLCLKITQAVLYTFVPNKLFGQWLDISPTSFMFLKTFI